MKLEWLESFLTFADELNFTRAALRTNLSQPAFFRQIQRLAEALDVQLYVKNGRNLTLTESGEKVARFAKDLSERVEDFQSAYRHGPRDASIVIAAGQGAYLYLLGPSLRGAPKSPHASLRLLTANHDETLLAVRSGKAHLGITVLEAPPDDLEATLLLRFRPILAVPSDHEFASRKQLTIKSLKGVSLIVPPEPSPLRRLLSRQFREAGLPLTVGLEASGWEFMLHLVSLGFGAAVVNGCCRLPRGVRAIPLKDLPTTDYYLLHRKGQFLFNELAALKSRIVAEVKGGIPLDTD